MKYSLLATTVVAALTMTIYSPLSGAKSTPTPDLRPQIGTYGLDLDARDESVKPGEDFFLYTNGSWYNSYELPADKSRYGSFTELSELAREQVKEIVDEIVGSDVLSGDEALIRDYYKAYMDTETINKKGISPLQPTLDEIRDLSTQKELALFFGKSWYHDAGSPIYSGIWYNRTDPRKYQLDIGVGGLGLPDREYYLNDDDRFVDLRAEYKAYIEKMLTFAGVEGASDKAQMILELEKTIAKVHWEREKYRDPNLTLNQITRETLLQDYPGFDWDVWFDGMEFKAPTLNVSEPGPLKAIIEIIATTPLDDWKDYLTFHAVSNNAASLSEDIYMAKFDFVGKTLSGRTEPAPRWKRAIDSMSDTESLGFAIGKSYAAKHFPEQSKVIMNDLVNNLLEALDKRLSKLDWMGEETKARAKAKLAAFNTKIGYPDNWVSFDGLEIKDDDLLGNRRRIVKFFHDKSVDAELKPTDRSKWEMTPQTVNAYYNASFNEVVFPAAILQPPFFDPNADAAVNYGAIGAVIGHEIGHGFDDEGSMYDENGIQNNWWTDEDRKAFEERSQMLVEQYNRYEPIEGNNVNGQMSLGENLGDLVGLAMAYEAYQISLNGREPRIIGGLTGDQRFFMSWAQVWKEKRTEQSMLNQIRSGIHSPGRYRALVPRNHDAWYEAFGVSPGDPLYLPPKERVKIW